jgi:hypothetical protein
VLRLNGIPIRHGIFITTSTFTPRATTIGVKTIDGTQLRRMERTARVRGLLRMGSLIGGGVVGLGVLYPLFLSFSLLASRFSLLASRCSPLVSRLSFLASRFSPLASRLSPLASRLSPLASRLSPLASRFSILAFRFSFLVSRFSFLVSSF